MMLKGVETIKMIASQKSDKEIIKALKATQYSIDFYRSRLKIKAEEVAKILNKKNKKLKQ